MNVSVPCQNPEPADRRPQSRPVRLAEVSVAKTPSRQVGALNRRRGGSLRPQRQRPLAAPSPSVDAALRFATHPAASRSSSSASAPSPSSGRASIDVMQPAQHRAAHHSTTAGLSEPSFRGVLRQCQVRATSIVIATILPKDSTEVLLAHHHKMVGAFALDGANHPLGIPVLPGRRGAVTISSMPSAVMRRQNAAPQQRSRSRMMRVGRSAKSHACTSCRLVHCAVGCSVTLKCRIFRDATSSTKSTRSSRNVADGTVKKSIATRPFA